MAFAGTILTGICVGAMQKAAFGTDPFTCFVQAAAYLFHTTYGNIYPIITGVFLVFALIFNRHLIGIATLMNLFLIGGCAEWTKQLLNEIPGSDSFAFRLILLVISLVVVCFSTSLYFVADLGVSAYDVIALTLSEKYKIAAFRTCRVACDLICCICGVLCKVIIGVGTVATALFMGPVIQWFNSHVSEKLLYGETKIAEAVE